MAAPEESAGEGVVAQGPAAPRGAALLPQLLQNRPPPTAEGRRVVASEEGQSGAAPPGREAVSEPVSSAFLLRQPTPASSSPAVGISSAPQENGLLAPPAPGSSARPFASKPHLVPSAPQNASQQLQDAARRVALQQGRSEAAAAAVPPPARLLPPKQLDTICVQLQPDQTKENERPAFATIATIQSQNVTTTQPVEKNAKVLGVNVVNPQVIRIEPLTGTGSHQFFLHNSSGPTIQLLLQRPHRQVSADKIMTQQILNEQRSKSPMQTPRGIVVSTNPANSIGNCEKKHREQKLKKTLKVKTRSGRISRPPKYKAKDYKFIKTEDLADCHQSDSDDYSELSVEEDEEGKDKGMPLFGPLAYDLRPKLFKCQTCEKSYIGKGGLARHYKLNPDHGPQESSPPPPMNSLCRMALLEDAGKANGESNLRTFVPPQVTVTNEKAGATENGQQSSIGGGKRKSAAQQKNICLLNLGPGRPRQPRRHGCPRNTARSRHSGCRPEHKVSAEHHSVLKRKARLKELIQQCSNEDFMELVAPHFAAVVTVFEFLLMKVKKDDPQKRLFPDVYREFEELHAVVMKMSQEYFSNPEIKEPVEIKNPKVAESLGMNSNLFGMQSIQAGFSPEHLKNFSERAVTMAPAQKRAAESSDEMLPLAKRSREQSLLENSDDYLSDQGMKEICATNEDFFPEDSSVANTCCGNRLAKEQHESLELEAVTDCVNPDPPCQPMKAGLENLQFSRTLELGHYPSCLFSCDEIQPAVSAENLQEKPMDTNSSWNTASMSKGSEFCNSLASEESSQNPDLPVLEENCNNGKYQLRQEANEDSPVNEKVEQPKDTDSVDDLEKHFPSSATEAIHQFENIAERACNQPENSVM